jgi:hypothetical protein
MRPWLRGERLGEKRRWRGDARLGRPGWSPWLVTLAGHLQRRTNRHQQRGTTVSAHHHALHQGAFEIKMIDGMPWTRGSINANNDTSWKPANHNRVLTTAA